MLLLEHLEARFILSVAPTVGIDLNVIGRPDLAAWGVPITMLLADLTGPEANGVRDLETIFVAGTGGGARIRVEDGGRADWVEVPDPVLGGTMMVPRDQGRVMFDGFVMDDRDFRGGLTAAAVTTPDGRGAVWLAWGEDPSGLKPGPILARLSFGTDGTPTITHQLAMEPEYRGGLALHDTHLILSGADVGYPFNDDLLVLPQTGGGGAPRVQGYDEHGTKVFDHFAGSPDLRNTGDTQFRLSPTLAGTLSPLDTDIRNGRYGFALDFGNGTDWPEVQFFGFDGSYIARLDLTTDPFVGWEAV